MITNRHCKARRAWWAPLMVVTSLLGATLAHGQDRLLTVASNADSAGVWIDGSWAGYVAQGPFGLSAMAKEVVVRPFGVDAWSILPLRFDLDKRSIGAVTLDARFNYHYSIQSIPSGAQVYLGGDKLGSTPMLHVSQAPLEESIRLELDGYHGSTAQPGDGIWNTISVTLAALPVDPEAVLSLRGRQRKGSRLNMAVAALSFTAAVLAIHYRTKADNRFDDYALSGTASLRAKINRLDRQSGIALGTMQLGLGFVAVRLIR